MDVTARDVTGLAPGASLVSHDPIDFQVFTYAAEPETYAYADDLIKLIGKPELRDQLAQLPRPIVPMVGSSTQRDLQQDRMSLSALQDMCQCNENLSIFLNHDYTLPESLYGSMQGQPQIHFSGEFADLSFTSDVEILNERAALTYLYSVRGRKMGVSGGFMVLGVQWIDPQTEEPIPDEDVDFWDIITGAVWCDITHVKMVEQSVVGIPANQRSWVESALKGYFTRTHTPKLAPIVRSLWPQQYPGMLAGVTDPALYQQLHDMTPRQQKTAAKVYFLPDGTLKIAEHKRERLATRKDVAALLTKQLPNLLPHNTQESAPMATTTGTPVATKSATGKTDWPLAERDRAWDSGAAHQRIVEWSGGTDDPDVNKLKSVHFFSPDGDDVQSVSKYKLLFADVIDGAVKAVPRAIFACAGSHGVDATTGIPDDEKATIKGKIATYYDRMAKEFDDPSIVVPWADEKSLTEHGLALVKSADGDVAVSGEGKHVAFTGTHAHKHAAMGSQGDDATHAHEHTHANDSDHDHDHAAKAGSPDLTEATEHIVVASPPTTVKQAEPAPAPVFPERVTLLKTYHDLLAPLGLDVVEAGASPDSVKCADWTPEEAAAIRAGIAAVDAASDALMRIAGVPDDDDFGGEADEAESADAAIPAGVPVFGRMSADLSRISQRMAGYALILKEGKRHSASDQALIQQIHDSCMSLGATCGSQEPAANQDDSPSSGATNNDDMQQARSQMATGKALETLETLAASFAAAADALKSNGIAALDTKAKALQDAFQTLSEQKDELALAFSRLSQTPLGRPTRGRDAPPTTRASDPAAVTLAQLQAPTSPATRHATLLAQTTVAYVKGVGRVRQWGDGVGLGSRPPLSAAQLDVLNYLPNGTAIRDAYEAGRAAAIPIVDDGD